MNAAQPRSSRLSIVLLLNLLLTASAVTAGRGQSSQCAPRQLHSLTPNPCPLASPEPSRPVFPTDNVARSAGGRELHLLLSSNDQSNSAKHRRRKGALVVLFYLAGDPPSVAIKPVFKCLPAFFNEEVQFVAVAYSELSLMALMSQGLHALPVLQVNAQGRRYRYSGKHRLRPMLHWVARALAQEPVVGLDVAQFCSSQQQLPPDPSDGPPNTCRPYSSLADAYAASSGAAAGAAGRCDRHSMCRREWQCSRWDGEVTLEELRAQQPAPLFYISLAFLVVRVMWLAHKWLQRHSRRRAAPNAAGAAAQAEPPAAQAGLGAAEAPP